MYCHVCTTKKKRRTGPCRFESRVMPPSPAKDGRSRDLPKVPRKTSYAAGADEDIVETGSDVNAGIL